MSANNKNISFQAPSWFADKITDQTKKEHITKSDLIRKALNEYFENHKEEN